MSLLLSHHPMPLRSQRQPAKPPSAPGPAFPGAASFGRVWVAAALRGASPPRQ
jgi:hypothetical protein